MFASTLNSKLMNQTVWIMHEMRNKSLQKSMNCFIHNEAKKRLVLRKEENAAEVSTFCYIFLEADCLNNNHLPSLNRRVGG